MGNWKKLFVGFFAIIGVGYVGLILFSMYGVAPDRNCTSYPVMSIKSPNGQLIAEQTQQVCSDDELLKTWVWLSDGKSVNFGGTRWSAFHALAAQAVGNTDFYQPLSLKMAWLSNSELLISFPKGTKVLQSEGEVNGIKVTYHEAQDVNR